MCYKSNGGDNGCCDGCGVCAAGTLESPEESTVSPARVYDGDGNFVGYCNLVLLDQASCQQCPNIRCCTH
jgi:hypothetical protein